MSYTPKRERDPIPEAIDAQRRSDAKEAIDSRRILTVYEVTYEVKHGRKWEKRENLYLVWEQAKHCHELQESDAKRNPNRCRNVAFTARSVFTHTYMDNTD